MKRFARHRKLAAAVVLLAALSVPAVATANLLANPGFEDAGGSYSGWFTFGSGVQLSLPAGDNIIRTGAAASKTFGEFTGCPSSKQFTVGGFGQAFTPVVGNLYTLSGYSYVSSIDPIPGTDTCNRNRLIAKIVFFDAVVLGNELASNEVVVGDGNSVVNQWNAFTVSTPAPAGARRVEALLLFLQPGCDAGAVFVDDCSFDASAPTSASNVLANPSFSTGLTGWTTFGNVFPDSRSFIVRTPASCAKMFGPFALPGDASGMYQAFSATPGKYWQLDVYSLNTCRDDPVNGTNNNFATAKISFRNAAGTEIGFGETVIADNTSALGTWTKHTVIAGAPVGTATVRAYLLFVQPGVLGGSIWVDDASLREVGTVSVDGGTDGRSFELLQNAPNPFRADTRIDFVLARRGQVEIGVFDVVGRRVATLFRGELEPGAHAVRWDGKSSEGASLAAGIYRYIMTGPGGRMSRSMVLNR